jgi:hypothetical protein
MPVSISNLQRRVIGPTEMIDYSNIISSNYPPDAIHSQPFIGFKVLCRDANACMMPPNARLSQIDANLGFLHNTGCIIRETVSTVMNDGFWIITMPVPRAYATTQLSKLLDVLTKFDTGFGIHPTGLVEINVSGRCNYASTEACLQRLVIPQPYANMIQVPENTPYRYGHVTRINDEYICFRSRWNIRNNAEFTPQSMFEQMSLLSQLLCSIYY